MKKFIKTLILALSAISLQVLASCNTDSSDNNAALLLLSGTNSEASLTEEDKDPNFTSGWYGRWTQTDRAPANLFVYLFDKNKNIIDLGNGFNRPLSTSELASYSDNVLQSSTYTNMYDYICSTIQSGENFGRIDELKSSDSVYKAILANFLTRPGITIDYGSPLNWIESNKTEWKAATLSKDVTVNDIAVVDIEMIAPYENIVKSYKNMYESTNELPEITFDESKCSVRYYISAGIFPNKDTFKASLIDSKASIYLRLPLEITGVSAGQTTVKLSYPRLEDIVINVNVTAAE